jgi:hypothetical protein
MGWFSDLLKEYPALEVAKERIALLETKFTTLETENAKLRDEVANLRRENEAIKRQLPSEDFVEARGVLFKRKADGSFEPDAYCPNCKRALALPRVLAVAPTCSLCHYQASFRARDLWGIVNELRASQTSRPDSHSASVQPVGPS